MRVRISITGKRKVELAGGRELRPTAGSTFADVRMDGAHPTAVAQQLRAIAADIDRNGRP